MRRLKNTEIRFETTNKCTYHCKICPREEMTRDQGIMSMELYKRLIIEGIERGLKYVTLTGFGEAFLDKHFIERAMFAKSCGLYVSVDTTGFALKQSIAQELIQMEFDFIRFSIFATTKEVYKKVHNLDKFDIVLSNVLQLMDLKSEKNSIFPKVGVYYVEQPENKHQTNDFLNFWVGKVDEVNAWKAHNWIDTYNFRKKGYKRKKTCGRPLHGPLQIRWNGEVSACCFDFNNQLIIGDLSKGTYDDLFEDARYKKLYDAHNSGDMKDYTICDNCDQLYEVPDTLIFSTDDQNKIGTSGNTFVSFE